MTLADFTSPGMIVPHLYGVNVPTVIQELSLTLLKERRITDWLAFYQAAMNREFMSSTGMEAGMAFPHARLTALKEVSFSLGRRKLPLCWGSEAVGSVSLVFLLAIPATGSIQYLQLMSGLARLAKNHRLVEQLHAAQNSSEMIEVLKEVEL